MRGPDKVVPLYRTTHTIHHMAYPGDISYSKKVDTDGFMCEYWVNGQRLGIIFYSIEELKQLRQLGVIDDSKLRNSQ